MKKQLSTKKSSFPKGRALITILLGMVAVTLMASGFEKHQQANRQSEKVDYAKDSIASVAAFHEVYKVLMHPRCMNCHPAGDVPLQGEDSHLHTMLPQRGPEGTGLYAMKCKNCHQDTNTPGLHTPPGNPKWHLPPANMKMVFQGRTPRQLALQLVNLQMNGGKSMNDLIEHASDTLVKAAWNPGEGRNLPPLSHQQFKKVWITWIETGAYAPAR